MMSLLRYPVESEGRRELILEILQEARESSWQTSATMKPSNVRAVEGLQASLTRNGITDQEAIRSVCWFGITDVAAAECIMPGLGPPR